MVESPFPPSDSKSNAGPWYPGASTDGSHTRGTWYPGPGSGASADGTQSIRDIIMTCGVPYTAAAASAPQGITNVSASVTAPSAIALATAAAVFGVGVASLSQRAYQWWQSRKASQEYQRTREGFENFDRGFAAGKMQTLERLSSMRTEDQNTSENETKQKFGYGRDGLSGQSISTQPTQSRADGSKKDKKRSIPAWDDSRNPSAADTGECSNKGVPGLDEVVSSLVQEEFKSLLRATEESKRQEREKRRPTQYSEHSEPVMTSALRSVGPVGLVPLLGVLGGKDSRKYPSDGEKFTSRGSKKTVSFAPETAARSAKGTAVETQDTVTEPSETKKDTAETRNSAPRKWVKSAMRKVHGRTEGGGTEAPSDKVTSPDDQTSFGELPQSDEVSMKPGEENTDKGESTAETEPEDPVQPNEEGDHVQDGQSETQDGEGGPGRTNGFEATVAEEEERATDA